ncbi:MAG: anaerobic ribonucleoside-triphosphate reductase activating protein, partial [Chitinispirillia bacterium]
WIKNSLIDFPGAVSTVLFFSGCNLRCPYCHNYQFVVAPSNTADQSEVIWEYLEKRKKLIDGVVLSGGEPTLQPNLKNIISEIRKLGLKVKLDTNGLLPEVVYDLTLDYLALDIKTIPSLYPQLLKADKEDIADRLQQSIKIVAEMKERAEVRITAAPRIISKEYVLVINELLYGVKRIYLQKVDLKNGVLLPSFFKSLNAPTAIELKEYQSILSSNGKSCYIRNE